MDNGYSAHKTRKKGAGEALLKTYELQMENIMHMCWK